MLGVFGIVLTFGMVFGGYVLAGGKLSVILHSLPYELMMIGGAAVGSFILSNNKDVIQHSLSGVSRALKGPRWKEQDLEDALCLLCQLLRIARGNPVELEQHIEAPRESTLFQAFPNIIEDRKAVSLICDALRSISLNYDDPYQVEEMLARRIGLLNDEASHAPHALQNMADALPALGIVAAVLGIVKTMSSIDQPPEVLGKMIGGALVGTFLGVFLAYAIVAPLAQRLQAVTRQDQAFYDVIKSVLVAGLHQHALNLCVEVGRQSAPEHIRPNFAAVESAIRDLRKAS
ncbi:flagellar motor stator protein MotA [Paracoccus ravus]|uniref:flagellar motor stator protein MotA n=1 Tax=Paracoccus ravus TaxID=2447760 RepID=UPI00106EF2FD|nr:flagellar motor stator protein MotA [Paracoccus ravus]